MRLTLKFNSRIKRPTRAVFIRGGEPSLWLNVISTLNVPVKQLQCYVVPASIQTDMPGGLLAILPVEGVPVPDHLAEYALLAGKLYLPVQSELFPPVSEDELKQILLWDVQFFHPVIGMVGFEKKDCIDLSSLIEIRRQINSDWNFAHPGQTPLPALQRISLEPREGDMLEEFKNEVDKKPLEDIPKPKTNRPAIIDRIVREIGIAFLILLVAIIKFLKRIFPESKSTVRRTDSGETSGNSWLEKLFSWVNFNEAQNWASKNLEQLQKERDEEIVRLLKMLDEDSFEALKYAIPLSTGFESRGVASPISRLLPRNLLFDLGLLGGGGPRDAWDIGNHFTELRNKYLRAALKEIERKNFKRAAYIYAHLLNDFNSAANVLVQGKMYREAATLYKDHLKNKSAAANCLEKGGLLNDAIDLYVELGNDEKAADLYAQLGLVQQSGKYYQRAAEKHYEAKDYLETARVYRQKLGQLEKASAVWLLGWKQGVQQEACLQQYFGLIREVSPDSLPESINGVYKSTPPQMRVSMLNVLLQLGKSEHYENISSLSTGIAYEVVSEQAELGNLNNMHLLKSFVNDDKMLSADLIRFVYGRRDNVQLLGSKGNFQLMKGVTWISACGNELCFLAIGFSKDRLVLARANWYGNVEYAFWSEWVLSRDLHLISRLYPMDRAILYSEHENSFKDKQFPQSKYFGQPLNIDVCPWLPKRALGIAFSDEGIITALSNIEGILTLSYYNSSGQLQNTIDCQLQGDFVNLSDTVVNFNELVYRNGFYFTIIESHLLAISQTGTISTRIFDAAILGFAACEMRPDRTEFLIATEENIYFVKFDPAQFLVWEESGPSEKQISNGFSDMTLGIRIPDKLLDIKFLSGRNFAVASHYEVEIFHFELDQLASLTKVQTTDSIVAVLATNNRNAFGILLVNGKVETYQFDPAE